jgi:thymidine phosphorylase
MDQPLGQRAGHANEVWEAVEVLKGRGPADLRELSLELSAWMFFLGDRTQSVEEGRILAGTIVATGQALEKLRQGIRLQGGDARVVDEPGRLPQARFHAEVTARRTGYITATNCENFGTALAMLGGGRERKEDRIDHSVGLEFHKRIGDRVEKNEKMVTIHYNSDAKLAEANNLIGSSYVVSERAPQDQTPLVRRIIGA